jgi:hypothetical protein
MQRKAKLNINIAIKRQFEGACYSFCISHGDKKCLGVQLNFIMEANTEAKVQVITSFQNVVPTSQKTVSHAYTYQHQSNVQGSTRRYIVRDK